MFDTVLLAFIVVLLALLIVYVATAIKAILECYGALVYISELFGGMTLQNILREEKY